MIYYVDGHVHAREPQTPEFNQTVPVYTCYSMCVYMMNLEKPMDISDAGRAAKEIYDYHWSIMAVAKAYGHDHHKALVMPVMANTWTAEQLEEFISVMLRERLPVAGLKLFTQGQSTNSGYAPDVESAIPLINVAAENGIPVAFHLEDPDEPNATLKEFSAMENILPKFIMRGGKKLPGKFSIEHVSTKPGLMFAERYGVNYTLTPHHLGRNYYDFVKPGDDFTKSADAEKILRRGAPWWFCKPLLGDRTDMRGLRDAWKGGEKNGNLMIGSDSAPHSRWKKELPDPNKRFAGIYTGDSRISYAAAMEEELDLETIDKLVEIYSLNTARFYGVDVGALKPAAKPCDVDVSGIEESKRVVNVLKMERENGASRG